MATTQEGRLLRITTPLADDFLLIDRLSVHEGISMLFSMDIDLVHEENEEGTTPTVVDPTSLLGQMITIEVLQKDQTGRTFSGMVTRFSQGDRNTRFSFYKMRVMPAVWMLTQNIQSRIFQHKSVPDILMEVFKGFEFINKLQGTYEQRNYCVQYRETDWDFASRLMEEEGIYYYFEHKEGAHKLIFTDSVQTQVDCPTKAKIPYYTEFENEDFVAKILKWDMEYQYQTGMVTLWDHNFQLPGKHLEAALTTRFSVGQNQTMEFYDYPAGYARKFDGVDRSTNPNPSDLERIYQDNRRTAEIAIQALDARYKTATGESDCSSLTSGYKFELFNHPIKEANGPYVVTTISHSAVQSPAYMTGTEVEDSYSNSFTTLSYAVPFRPKRSTPKPLVRGSQTAIVVGPASEEIFTDMYGRVKVQFHWDRDGQSDADSSCWMRVAQSWASNNWGTMFIPRIGMEVVVDFLEGDPDQPIITGCVYNPKAMPPYKLPDHKTMSTVKSNSSKDGGGFNEIRFEDKKGDEHIFVHAQKDQHIRVKQVRREIIGADRHLTVYRDKREKIKRDTHQIIERDVIEKIERDHHRHVQGKAAIKTDGSVSNQIGGSLIEKIGESHVEDVAQEIYLKAGLKIVLEAGMQISLKVGGNFVDISPAGVTIVGSPMVLINSGGAAGSGSMQSPVAPLDPDEAEIPINADPGSNAPTYKNQQHKIPERKMPSYKKPTHKPKDNEDKKSWIEIELYDDDGDPVPGERYRVTLPDGTTLAEGTTDEKGYAKVSNIDPGNCKVTFPELDGRAWDKK